MGVRERRSGAPYLAPAALALVAVLAGWAFVGRLASCGAALESPETQVRKAVASQTRAHLADVYGFRAGGTLELTSVRFEDVAPTVERGRATVVAVLTAQGRVAWRDQEAAVSYVGRERFHMQPCAIALWCAEGDQFDRLRGVLALLFRRLDAVEARDVEAYGRLLSDGYQDHGEDRAAAQRRLARELAGAGGPVRVVAWQIRVERGGAEVGEDLEVSAPEGPPRRQRRVYRLASQGERWVLASGA